MKSTQIASFVGAFVLALSAGTATTQPAGSDRSTIQRAIPAAITAARLDAPIMMEQMQLDALHPSLAGAQGEQRVIVRLRTPSVIEQGLSNNAAAQAKGRLRNEQNQLLSRIQAMDPSAEVVAQVQMVMNAVFVRVDAAVLPQLANDSAVMRIAPVGDYELDLEETVPYIFGDQPQTADQTGRGIKVAVLDSGVDYTHADLGGPGTVEFYQQCYGVSPFDAGWSLAQPHNAAPIGECADYFGPSAPKVKGGFDFVGELWPNAPEAPDPNPIDLEGHGTNVADIIGGRLGVAPDVDIYAVKVCSAVAGSCSGIALIQGMEFAVNPSGDGRLRDRVDIINMSLGSSYGQPFDDDLAAAVDVATGFGILTVASAGNSADKPYATGTPSSADSALSVAQTAVPSDFLPLMQITAPANLAGSFPAVFQPWSTPLTSAISGPVQYGDGAGGNLLGCNAFPAGTLSGKIVLVDRGACSFTLKIKNIGDAGGAIGIIGLVAPGDPFTGGDGGDRPITAPGFMVSQAVSNRLKSGIPSTQVTFDPNVGLALAGSMVGSSSRGPQPDPAHRIKPEIGAPGASVSADAGTGSGRRTFGGTSGAAPMVAGAAAILLEATGGTKATGNGTPNGRAVGVGLRPIEVKARLMNNAETNIVNDAVTGALAPISRIGGGEVRIDRAIAAPAAVWDNDAPQAALGFGFIDVADDTVTLTKTVRVRNYSNKRIRYSVTPTFRFANDETNGAVSISAPSQVNVGPGRGSDTLFTVTMTIDGSKLRGNFMNSGSEGANPATLTTNEYDGYLVLDDGSHPIHLPWHVLPRKAASVVASTTTVAEGAFSQIIGLDNQGVGTAQVDAYALLASNPRKPRGGRGEQAPSPSIRAVGINTFPVGPGFCSANPSFLWAFAVSTWDRQQHLLPVSHQIYLDTNQDGIDDYVILNRDASGLGTISDGRQLSWVLNLATGTAGAFFFAEHSMNTGNTVLLACAEQLGMSGADVGVTNVNMDVVAQDFYYGGGDDEVTGLTVTPLGERFLGIANDVPGKTNDSEALEILDFGLFPGNTDELGILLFTNGDRGAGNRGGATQETEAILLLKP